MADHPKYTVFLSYSWNDQQTVFSFRNALAANGIDVWMDTNNVKPGDHIGSRIEEGLRRTDIYVVFLSQSATSSPWVRREISYAVQLADKKKLTPIPVLLDAAEVPIEFSGLLYIDARRSIKDAAARLVETITAQKTKIGVLDKQRIVVKSVDPRIKARLKCFETLEAIDSDDLRFHMAERLGLSDVKVLWFDLFSRKMEDEVRVENLPLSVIELLDRARREELLTRLREVICRNFPRFSIAIANQSY